MKPSTAESKMLLECNGGSAMSTELFIKDVTVTSGTSIQFRDGWEEGCIEFVRVDNKSLTPIVPDKEQKANKSKDGWDSDFWRHGWYPWLPVIILFLLIIYEIERFGSPAADLTKTILRKITFSTKWPPQTAPKAVRWSRC